MGEGRLEARQIVDTAETLIEANETSDPFSLCEKLDIAVLERPLPDSLFGLAYSPFGCRYVVLRPGLEAPFRNFVCAHELGHHLLHPHVVAYFVEEETLFRMEKYEWQAHLFAVRLLTWELESWDIPRLSEVGIPPNVAHRFAEHKSVLKYFSKEWASWQAEESPNGAIRGLM
ncbi:MAG: ImmA/IrrE family metallo-endopeptidase [Alicyclobacillaceae bacterium]|nr:ImmA/IrrE family metallo-endopeptidase [Alicyclobacillaceae bacterium]